MKSYNNRFVQYFKEDKDFRVSIFFSLLGIAIAIIPRIIGLTGRIGIFVTFLGVGMSFVATEKISRVITIIGAQDYEDRQEKKNQNK